MASPERAEERRSRRRREWLAEPVGWWEVLAATAATAALVSLLDALEGHVQAVLIAWLW